MYLLDASAITLGLRLHGAKAFRSFVGHQVLDLTKFELGNTAWKEYAVLKKGTEATARQDLLDFREVIGFLGEYAVTEADLAGIMDIALGRRLTFYDASYMFVAGKKGLTLVTEDQKLRLRAAEAGLETTGVSGVIKDG